MKTENQTRFEAELTAAYRDLFATDPAYSYSASKTTPEGLAARMVAAFLEGSGNHDGAGIRAACRAIGIPCTLKAISEFVGYVAPAKVANSARVARNVLVIGLSNIETAISGVARISRAYDLVTLEYTDGKREAGTISATRWADIAEKPFAIVSEIQAQRTPATQ